MVEQMQEFDGDDWVNVGEEVVVTSPYGIEQTSVRTAYLQNGSCP